MARQQERARRTRAAIIGSAAAEFSRSGYAAASLNRILAGSNATKGALYFHFDSKEDLARAVMDAARERHEEIVGRWSARSDVDPLEALHLVLDEVAELFETDPVVRADFRMHTEPDLHADGDAGSQVWIDAVSLLLARAEADGKLASGTDVAGAARTLSAALVGQGYLWGSGATESSLRDRYTETLELILLAVAAPDWLAEFRRTGWRSGRDPAVTG